MEDDGFRRVLARGGIAKKVACGTPYVKNMTELRRKKVGFCRKDDIMLRPERRNALSRAASQTMTTEYIPTFYEEMKKEV